MNAHRAQKNGYLLIVRHGQNGHRFAITTPDNLVVYSDGYPAYESDLEARKAAVEFLESSFGIAAEYESLPWTPTSIESLAVPPSD